MRMKTPNIPFEQTVHQILSAKSAQASCLPLRFSVTTTEGMARAAEIVEQGINTGQPML